MHLLQYWTIWPLDCYQLPLCCRSFVCIAFVTKYFSITLLRVVPVLAYSCYNNEHFVHYIVTRYPCVGFHWSVLHCYNTEQLNFVHYINCYEMSLCLLPLSVLYVTNNLFSWHYLEDHSLTFWISFSVVFVQCFLVRGDIEVSLLHWILLSLYYHTAPSKLFGFPCDVWYRLRFSAHILLEAYRTMHSMYTLHG